LIGPDDLLGSEDELSALFQYAPAILKRAQADSWPLEIQEYCGLRFLFLGCLSNALNAISVLLVSAVRHVQPNDADAAAN
jgi:hypothetical protein